MKKIVISISSLISCLIILMCILMILYYNGIKPVNNNKKIIEFEVKENNNYYSIANKLYEEGLIKSTFWYKVYLKLNKPSKIKSGLYSLRSNMSVSEIVDTLSKNGKDINTISITFKEGYNFYDIIDTITYNTNNKEEDIINLLNDEEYLEFLIDKYWFITEEIKNELLYYPLEGYLYPDTYQFKNKDVTVKEIFEALLNQMEQKLNPYKEKINESNYSIHNLLTLASIIELEGVNDLDRKDISGVFYNRLKNNMNLGSDVTAYYGAKVRLSERDLYKNELNDNNGYNTRISTMAGKLPIGPICNPSIESIEASINPNENDYYYFVSDKNKKTYFSKTLTEHNQKIQELKRNNLWYNYE